MNSKTVHHMNKARQVVNPNDGSLYNRPLVPLHMQGSRSGMRDGSPGFTRAFVNRRIPPRIQPRTRNVQTGMFRRYLNGTLDVDGAQFHVEEGLRKAQGGIPLTEFEALAVMAVYPERAFVGLTQADVRLKAYLSESEKALLRNRIAGK